MLSQPSGRILHPTMEFRKEGQSPAKLLCLVWRIRQCLHWKWKILCTKPTPFSRNALTRVLLQGSEMIATLSIPFQISQAMFRLPTYCKILTQDTIQQVAFTWIQTNRGPYHGSLSMSSSHWRISQNGMPFCVSFRKL